MEELISTFVTVLQDSVGVKDVFLWLGDTGKLKLTRQGSSGENAQLKMDQRFINALVEKKMPFLPETPWARGFLLENRKILERFQACLFVPLILDRQVIGVILLGKKTTGEPFLGDDFDLLRSAAAQITSAIVNAKLSEDLLGAKEMEVFHRLSSFVLHDLKNLVSNLSLVVQNAGEHISNPQFQKDALETIGKSVEKMEALIARLSTNAVTVKPKFMEADLNELVSEAVSRMGQNGQNDKTVKVDLRDIPRVLVDREQIEKVVVNFFLNAIESLDNGGLITIETEANEDKVILSVIDNGCGMSPDYVENSLFKPFKSTKKKGLGIGLYQCKTIIEAHNGRIEVESREGEGSTFRIFLPACR
jgi:putative PEP-CTERM system histidine kinase